MNNVHTRTIHYRAKKMETLIDSSQYVFLSHVKNTFTVPPTHTHTHSQWFVYDVRSFSLLASSSLFLL